MRKGIHKYFWDGEAQLSEAFKLKRIIEYASFPDMISYPIEKFKEHLSAVNIERLRTSEKRKRFIQFIAPLLAESNSWDDIFKHFLPTKG